MKKTLVVGLAFVREAIVEKLKAHGIDSADVNDVGFLPTVVEVMWYKDLDPRFEQTFFVVEANSYEQMTLWREHAEDAATALLTRRYKWEKQPSNTLVTVGECAEMPVTISCSWTMISDHLIMFYEYCSMITHSKMVDEWLKQNCNPKWDNQSRRAHANSTTFHHCLQAIDEFNGTF